MLFDSLATAVPSLVGSRLLWRVLDIYVDIRIHNARESRFCANEGENSAHEARGG
jgi:hypothetical protein